MVWSWLPSWDSVGDSGGSDVGIGGMSSSFSDLQIACFVRNVDIFVFISLRIFAERKRIDLNLKFKSFKLLLIS